MVARNGNVDGRDADEQDVLLADTDRQETSEDTSDLLVDGELDDTGAFTAETEASDNVGMSSVQFDVEDLISEFESEAAEGVDKNGRLRKRLDAIMERKRRHKALEDFDDYDLDS